MKNIMLYLLIISLPLIGSCQKKQPLEDYEIQRLKESLSLDEIETSLDLLGLDIERFDYYLPHKSKLSFYSQKYINGVAQNITNQSSLYPDPGMQRILIFAKKENNIVSFYAQAGGGRVGCGRLDFTGFDSTTQGPLNVKEINTGPEVPLYVFAANESGIESFSFDDNIDQIVEKYQLVFVLYADVQ
jgi:hypothetical protein